MKKLIALLLALCMIFALAACGGPAVDDNQDEPVGGNLQDFEDGNASKFDKEELPRYKFAFTYYTFSDKLGSQFKSALEYLGEAYNVEFVFFESGFGDAFVTNVESVLAAGDIDGILTCGGTPATVAVANKYNVPYIMVCSFPSLEEEIQGVCAYDNFLGGVVDDDEWAGTRCIEALYEAGCRNICYSGYIQGAAKSQDDRANSMKKVVAAHDDLNLLADSYTAAEFHLDVATFSAAYPEMDGIGFTAMSDSIYQAMETEGIADGSVKISGIDISTQTGTYLEKGVQVWTCGGQYATAMISFAILYNYVSDGTRIIEDPSQPLTRKYMEINSYEDYVEYVKYVENPLPVYDADEIADMIHIFNPDVTYQDYVDDANNYTLEDVIARHGDKIG